ncbi:MAG: adenylate/guanylate cyclase domain-containing protein, partial [Acidimicrobiia bacterium]
MDRFMRILSDGVHRFEGTVDKFTGDGVMALFGAPVAHEDHARRACYAALHLADAIGGYAEDLRRTKGLSFHVRIGINSGEVVVGAIGDDSHMEYTAVGHTVGLASRMEALAEPGKAYLTEHTARLAQGYFRLRDLGTFTVKGAREPGQPGVPRDAGRVLPGHQDARPHQLPSRVPGRLDAALLLPPAVPGRPGRGGRPGPARRPPRHPSLAPPAGGPDHRADGRKPLLRRGGGQDTDRGADARGGFRRLPAHLRHRGPARPAHPPVAPLGPHRPAPGPGQTGAPDRGRGRPHLLRAGPAAARRSAFRDIPEAQRRWQATVRLLAGVPESDETLDLGGTARARLARIAFRLGAQPGEAEAMADEARALAERRGDPVGLAMAVYAKGFLLFGLGRLDEAVTLLSEAIRLGDEIGNREIGIARTILAFVLTVRGPLPLGLTHIDEMLELAGGDT